MKAEELTLFEAIMSTNPKLMNIKRWEKGPDPPDILVTDEQGRRLGIELTEWLDPHETTRSITIQHHKIKWLLALDTEHHVPPVHFSPVQITFRDDVRFSPKDRESFCSEFYSLIKYLDKHWSDLFGSTPQKVWNDFTKHATLARYIHAFWLCDNQSMRVYQRWVISEAKWRAVDPHRGTDALIARIESKKAKSEYASLKARLHLDELILLVHYGLRGILHNTHFAGVNGSLEDVLANVCTHLEANAGPFDRIFLYFGYNEGRLEQVFPVSALYSSLATDR